MKKLEPLKSSNHMQLFFGRENKTAKISHNLAYALYQKKLAIVYLPDKKVYCLKSDLDENTNELRPDVQLKLCSQLASSYPVFDIAIDDGKIIPTDPEDANL